MKSQKSLWLICLGIENTYLFSVLMRICLEKQISPLALMRQVRKHAPPGFFLDQTIWAGGIGQEAPLWKITKSGAEVVRFLKAFLRWLKPERGDREVVFCLLAKCLRKKEARATKNEPGSPGWIAHIVAQIYP